MRSEGCMGGREHEDLEDFTVGAISSNSSSESNDDEVAIGLLRFPLLTGKRSRLLDARKTGASYFSIVPLRVDVTADHFFCNIFHINSSTVP